MKPDWSDEEEAELLQLLASGLTRRQIAERLGTTKSAICGKVFRMKKQDIRHMTPNAETIAAMNDPGEIREGTTEEILEAILAEKSEPRVLMEGERDALRWFAERGPTPGLDVTTVPGGLRIFPTARMRDHLLAIGMLERRAPLGMYLYEMSEDGRAALAATKVEDVHMVGKYRADYSALTEAEISADQSPEIEELFRNSTPVNRRT